MEEYFQKALSHCIDIGMKQPCILCAVSPNGSVLAMRFNEGHDPDPLTEPFENDTFTAPLNLMVVDRDGKAMRVVISETGKMMRGRPLEPPKLANFDLFTAS